MHDTLIINIPLQTEFVQHLGGVEWGIRGDLHMYGIRTYGGIRFDIVTGKTEIYDLKSPFESLPSSFESMAVKFYHQTKNCIPFVSLNASPKFLQGHNVYGALNIEQLATEMLGVLKESYPIFWHFLDVAQAEIARVDVTYSTKLPHDDLMPQIIDMVGRVSVGQRKPDATRNVFANTRYWGVAKNRVGYCKLYGKDNEIGDKLKTLRRKARSGSLQAQNLLNDVFNDELEQFAKNLLRFEATNKKDMFVKQGLPTNLWQFIIYQRFNKDCLYKLWEHWFNPILNALEGEIMTNIDDSEVLELCKQKLTVVTKTGKVSQTRAMNAYRFYCFLKDKGFIHAQSVTDRVTFYRNIKALVSIGIPKSHLQNLNGRENKCLPICELIKFDFTKQTPPNYKPPKSRFYGEFDEYLKCRLHLVA